ncbi:MAG: DUF4296 domain-containing protein [Bacteroidota bacterium]
MRSQSLRLGLLVAALTASACGDAPEADGVVLADSSLVSILADLHLADARAETTGEPTDSLQRAVLLANGLDSTAFAERLADATRTTADATALYQAVTDQLQATAVETPDSTGPDSTGS